LLLWAEPCVRHLIALIGGELHSAWANINGPGDFNRAHTHGVRFERSGVYIVEGDAGALVFEPDEIAIEPEPGKLILFPSGMRHRVEPYQGDTQRITIAFNFKD